MRNALFQNTFWFCVNAITLGVLWYVYGSAKLSVLHIAVPTIWALGVISLVLLFLMDFTTSTEDSIPALMENFPCWIPTKQVADEWYKFKADKVEEVRPPECNSDQKLISFLAARSHRLPASYHGTPNEHPAERYGENLI